MKKSLKIGALGLAVASLFAFTACGSTTSLSFTAYWYKDSTNSNYYDTNETLTYKVTGKDGTNSNYKVTYNEGRYVTNFCNDTSRGQSLYKYTTKLSIGGEYTMGSEKLAFEDSVETTTYFTSVTLTPVYAERKVHSTSPVAQTATSLSEAVKVFDYTITASYSEDMTKVDIEKNGEKNAVTLTTSPTAIDNDTLLFAARGLSGSAATTLSVMNTFTATQSNVTLPAPSSATFTTTIQLVDTEGEETSQNIGCYYFAFYTGNKGAKNVSAYYAADSDNVFRHAMLYMETPLSYNLGTLAYQLIEADFCNR